MPKFRISASAMVAAVALSGAFLGVPALSVISTAVAATQENTATDADALASPVGVWRTLDDKTHQPKALIEIKQNDAGIVSGKIVTGIGANHSPGSRCTACVDERKDQPMQGLTIIRNMTRQDGKWVGGDILDPQNGKTYHCEMSLADNGEHLLVRGYIGIPLIGRSQTWIREHHPAAAEAAATQPGATIP